MLAHEVVQEAFRLRQLWDPSRHRILRYPPEVVEEIEERSPREPLWQEFEPTAFLYAYTALNNLYTFNWFESTDSVLGHAVEAEGRELDNLKQFISFVLEDEEQRRYFVEGIRAVVPKSGGSLVEVLKGLYPFPDSEGNLTSLREDVIAISQRLISDEALKNIVPDVKVLFKAVYIVRCNIFHGRKGVLDLANDHPQLVRIGVFRQMIVALIDTFFSKVRSQYPYWDTYFEGHLGETVSRPVTNQ